MSNWKNKEKVLKAIYMEDYIPDVMEKIDPSLLADRDVIQYAVCIDGCSLFINTKVNSTFLSKPR